MRVYKSPVQLKPSNMQKKSSINFIKNVAAPKQIKTQQISNSQNFYNDQNHANHSNSNLNKYASNTPSIDKYRGKQNDNLCLVIKQQTKDDNTAVSSNSSKNIKKSIINSEHLKSKKAIKVFFPFNPQTQIKNLIGFVHNQIQDNMIYLKSPNIYIDYILGLKDFKVKRLVDLLISDEQTQTGVHINSNNEVQIEIICCGYEQIQNNNYLKNFQIIKCVGSGGFSKVYLVRAFGKLMAMKVINKEYILSNDKANIINNQKSIISSCSDHPFITYLYTSFETKNFLIFAMEFCNGGELFNLLRKVRRMKQQEAKFYFVQTLSAIAHLHRKGIVYRDIKPQNIIIDHEGHIRLADFGLSKIMEETRQGKTYSFCGSAQYMAPEMLLKKGHSYQIDFYCLGALLYELVIGLPPYYSRNQNQLFSNIIHNDLQFPAHVNLSQELKNFLINLLEKDVQKRYQTLAQIISDPWMKNIRMEEVLDKRLKPPFKTDMFGYNFDDSDFAEEEKQIIQKLESQKNYSSYDDNKFEDFFFESKEISDLRSVIYKSHQQGLFNRTNNNHVGQFMAQSFHLRTISNSGSIIINKQSRQPSVNRLQHSKMNIPSSLRLTRRIESQVSPRYQHESSQISQVVYYPSSKGQLNSVRSLQHINPMRQLENRSQQRITSINKVEKYPNIYTSHRQQFHPFGVKTSNSSLMMGVKNGPNIQNKSVTYIRQPNYYSVQKSSNRGEGARLDIQNLSIKNHRNYSVEKVKDIYSSQHFNNSQSFIHQTGNNSIKHVVSEHSLKKSYLDGYRDTLAPSKVKKSSYKNGQKISISLLNNVHYRN